MKLNNVIGLIITFVLLSCSSTNTKATPSQITALDNLVKSQSYSIVSNWALPQSTRSLMMLQNAGLLAMGDSASRISLMGNPNELKLNKNNVSSRLPFFGEVQSTSGYNGGDNSITLDGELKEYRVVKNENSSYTIRFDAVSHSENFNVTIHLYPNLRSEIILRGAKRFPIRYTGYVSLISE